MGDGFQLYDDGFLVDPTGFAIQEDYCCWGGPGEDPATCFPGPPQQQ